MPTPRPTAHLFPLLPAALLPALLAALLSACGGGGGGGSAAPGPATPAVSPALTFTPATVTATVNAGTSLTLNVGATVARPADFANAASVFATVTDATGVIQPSVQLVRDSDTQYHAALQTAPALAAGSYRGSFTVRLCRDSACAAQFPGSPMLLPYELQVVPAGQSTFSAVSALPLTATASVGGAAPAAAMVAISAAPGRSWTANTGGVTWLKLGSASGTGNASLSVSYDASGLAPGQYATTLGVTASDGQSATLPVALTVVPSGLVFGNDSLSFTAINGAPIPAQALSVTTDDKTPATWSAVSSAAWLRVSPLTGTTPNTTVLTVDPGVGPLASGSYAGTVKLNSARLAERTLPVNLTLLPATLLTSSNSVTLGGPYGRDFGTTQPLTLSLNTGSNNWPWTITKPPAWATLSASAGSVGQAGAGTVFTARPVNAAVGVSSQLLTVSSKINGDTVNAGVLLTINKDQHKLIPAEVAVALSASPGWTRLTHTVAVSDNYGSFGGMTAASSQPWLTVTVNGANLVLSADPTLLAADSLNLANVIITPSAKDVTFTETIRVGLWKGARSPAANLTLPQAYTTVVTDPLRPYAYAHNGSAYVDIYNLYTGAKVASLTGLSTSLGDMATTANGTLLLLHDIANARITSVGLNSYDIVAQTPLAVAGDKNTRLKVIRPNGVEMVVLSDGSVYARDDWRRLPSLPLGGGTLGASGDGKRVLQQGEGKAEVAQTTVSVDYAELNNGSLFATRLPVASHNGIGTLGQDLAVSADGARIYSASSTPAACSVLNPADLGVLAYLDTGGGAPNNVEVDSDGRAYCGAATRTSGSDLWIYDASGRLVAQKRLAAAGRQLLPRQMAVSGDTRLLIGITDDGATTIVPVGP